MSEANGQNGAPAKGKKGGGTIEQIYQKKSQLEHILLRPDTYIGSVEETKELMWIFQADPEDPKGGKMVQKEIRFVPGLYKIFDEILVNAADNKQRDKNMSKIKIDINAETNTISVWNDGQGIPVVMHQTEKMFVPTMIFGHLLTSSNYNDDEQKVTGGRNGYGAKLCNIFSTKFVVETASRQYKKCFKQTWGDNMSKAAEPRIADFRGEDYTKITFSPDLTKFKMEKLDDDIVGLMSRRAYDVAASSRGVTVFLNGNKLPIKGFKDYIDLYVKDFKDDVGAPLKVVYENVNDRWEIAMTSSERGFQQVSFVNSIATYKGGRHVDHVTEAITKQLIETLKKKNKGGISIKPFQVKNHLWVFVNCLIVNPTFDSQTKENMTLQAKSFGSKCTLTEKFMKGVASSGIVESVLQWAKFKAQTVLEKTSGKKQTKLKGIPKLEDANDAGTKNAHLCTLILTEGDSAKTLAVSGLGVVGRDLYGVFPLRGKLLNTREATHKQILENAEINNLIKIIGLQYKTKYTTLDQLKHLRYGKVMIMTDQDQDGSHIKGLLINFIHTNWPDLLRLPFLEEFITPIVKATKKKEELSFFSLPEFEEWKADTPNSHTYNVKYYKGLGTSTSKEAKEYFSNMDRHRVLFKYGGTEDDENIIMAFAKKAVDQRKEWLTHHMDECKRRKELGLQEKYLYTKETKAVTYSEFINLELVLFSNSDNVRSIPSAVDGFKPGQRKILYTCIKRNDKREVKVAQLAGSVAEQSAYHHGEVSLCMTIVNMAQNYVGSNNVNLLVPSGQFGTRLTGGKDSASPRYIFTMMSPLTRLIFHPHDDPLLQYQYDDNQKIEPTWYIPIIPMILVNGCEGIGTGWSTKIPNHCPRQIIRCLRKMIAGDEPELLHPYYKNFRGQIEAVGDTRYFTTGTVSIIEDVKIEITELPIGTWTTTYKENVLEPLLHGTEKVKPVISDYKEYHTDTTVRFVISFAAGQFDTLEREMGGFHRVFKLSSSMSTNCMHGFDHNNCLRKYEKANDILREFFELRVEYYAKRKEYLEGMLTAEADKLSDQARFIMEKCNGTLVVENKKRKTMIDELIKRGYRADPVKEWKRKISVEDEEEADEPAAEEEEESEQSSKKPKAPVDPEKAFQKLTDVKKYDYLLGMSMWMLTEERKNELLKQRDNKVSELNILKKKTKHDLWLADLEALEKKLNEIEEKERQEELNTNAKAAKSVKSAKGKAAAGGGGGRKRAEKSTVADLYPSEDGIKVEYKLTDEIIKKYEKLDVAVERKKTGATKKTKGAAGDSIEEERDEFDDIVSGTPDKKPEVKKEANAKVAKQPKAPKEPKVKKEKKADGLKQSKLSFKKKKKGSDSEDEMEEDGSFEASPPVRETARRAASKKVNYAALLKDDEDDDSDNDVKVDKDGTANFSSDDELFDNNISVVNSENMFDSLKEDKSAETSPEKPKQKRKLGPKMETAKRPKKKNSYSGSDDDFEASKPKSKKKKKAISSSEEMSDSDSDF
ncbi:DNA topoisomerase 2 [Bradysia coprophila]|uniref:DNA topoisomerase 2 n=1 Tax=Bradysia coprophila TaxID=38358 RepID=UPI00187D77C9|nr:DNA topoisomerase 2 [Bradysia coprophila]